MKLNALLKTLGFLALAATPVVAGPSAPAPKNPIAPAPVNDDLGITATIGYDSNYVWRGINYGQHWVRAGLNGALLLVGGAAEDGAGSTSLLWDVNYGSLAGDQDSFSPSLPAFTGISQYASFQRLQLGAAISHDFGPASVSFGYSFIHNMGSLANGSGLNNLGFLGNGYGMNDIQQLTLGVNTNLGPINLASSANYDLFNGGWYFDLTARSTITVTDAISIVPHVGLGYGLNYNAGFTQATRNFIGSGNVFGSNSAQQGGISGWTALNAGIDFPIKLNSRATLTPYVAANLPMGPMSNLSYSSSSNGGFLGGPSNAFRAVVYYGVSLSVRF